MHHSVDTHKRFYSGKGKILSRALALNHIAGEIFNGEYNEKTSTDMQNPNLVLIYMYIYTIIHLYTCQLIMSFFSRITDPMSSCRLPVSATVTV